MRPTELISSDGHNSKQASHLTVVNIQMEMKRAHPTWTREMEKCILEKIIKVMKYGERSEGTWKT